MSSIKQACVEEAEQGFAPPRIVNCAGKPKSGKVMEKVTAAVLMTRREATAEASLARRRDWRKLGAPIAAMIRITATTSSNSISENPLCLRMNSPQASVSVGGRGPGGVGRHGFVPADGSNSVPIILFESENAEKVILLKRWETRMA